MKEITTSGRAEFLAHLLSTLPDDIKSRVMDIESSRPDPEPYRDGTYGDMPEVGMASIENFVKFNTLLMNDGFEPLSPGRGETSLGVQVVHDDGYVSLEFRANGVVMGAVLTPEQKFGFKATSVEDAYSQVHGAVMQFSTSSSDVQVPKP